MNREKPTFSDIAGKIIPKYRDPRICQKIKTENLNVDIDNLPKGFIDHKICHLSDLHNVDLFGKKPKLLEKISQENPNILVISGDSINNNKINNALRTISLLEPIIDPSNIFITTGNHEFRRENLKEISKTEKFFERLKEDGVIVLRNDFKEIKKNNDSVYIIGLEDPFESKNETEYLRHNLNNLTTQIPENKVKILISHRPKQLDLYSQSQYSIDLVFSGHAHGGQMKIPFTEKSLYAPNQGLSPEYIDGIYIRGKTEMIVSPGLSNEFMIPRFKNPGKIYFVNIK